MDRTPLPPEIAAMSFEDALKSLEEVVRRLESGQIRLDDAVAAYEWGSMLRQHCEQRLAEAKAKIEKISVGADGSVGVSSFDPV